jgi:hypothetical protein
MKYESSRADRLSADLFIDIEACQNIYKEICESKHLSGFVQEIVHSPFGFLLFSEIQVSKIVLRFLGSLIVSPLAALFKAALHL